MKPNEQKLKSEFVEFNADPRSPPPAGLALRIKRDVEQNLEPAPAVALMQGSVLHAVSGAITLLFCPQFGIGPLGGGKGIMGFVEAYGHLVCGLFCGAFFMSLTAVLMPVLLDRPIRKVLSRHSSVLAGLWTLSSLFALLLMALMIRGEVPHLHAEFLVAWIAAASLSAYAGILRPRFQ